MQKFKNLDDFAKHVTRQTAMRGLRIEEPSAKDFGLSLDIVDVVDGYYIARPVVRYGTGRSAVSALLETSGDLPVEVSGGPANIEVDKLNNNILISPKSDETVHAAGKVPTTLGGSRVTLTSRREEVGITTDLLSREEASVQVAGGGACAARWTLAATIDFNIQVRASIMANVMPRSLTRREISWRHGRYFAHHPQIGFMSLYYDPDRPSRISMSAKDADKASRNEGFFPATAKNQIYFICDFIDLGFSAFTRKPMMQTID